MSALPAEDPMDHDLIASQDETHVQIRDLLAVATGALLYEQPSLGLFEDHRPQRDRPSGDAWNGLETMCHVSALLVAQNALDLSAADADQLLGAVDTALEQQRMARTEDHTDSGVRTATWRDRTGVRLDVVIGVRVAVRAISMPFLPGSMQPLATTSPSSPISPLTPPPRPLR